MLHSLHVYKSDHVRYLDCYIYAPTENIWVGDPKRGAPLSRCNNITMRNIQVESQNMFDVKTSVKYELIDFTYDGKPLNF